MRYTIDFIIAGIVLLAIFTSAKRGFVRIVIETVGFVLALFLTFTIQTPLAEATYDKMIAPVITEAVSDTADGTAQEVSGEIWEKLPAFVKNNSLFPGVTQQALDKTVGNGISDSGDTAAYISETLIQPTAVRILSLIYSVVLMAVFMIAVRFIAAALNRAFSFRLVGKLNTALGAAVGIVRGLIAAVAFCLVISLLVSFTRDGIWIFTPEAIENSWFMGQLSDFHIGIFNTIL